MHPPQEIEMRPRYVREYGCVQCQTGHRQPDPLYEEHLYYQSKHGWYEVLDKTQWDPPANLGRSGR